MIVYSFLAKGLYYMNKIKVRGESNKKMKLIYKEQIF
jgi:hypothetical protein